MDKKGFTLVELLAVIIIMAILITVAVPSVLIFSNNMKKNMYCNKIDTIEKAAILYGEDNYDSIFGSKTLTNCVVDSESIQRCQKVTLKALMSKGYLKKEENLTTGEKDEIYDPRSNESMKDTEVYVTIKNKRPYATYVYKTKSDAELCDGQLYISDDKVTIDPEDKTDDLYNKDTSIPTCTFSYNVTLQSSGWFNKYPTPTVITSEAGTSGLKFGYGETSTPNYDLGLVRAGKIGKKEVTPILQDTAGKTIYCFVSSLEGKENVISEEVKVDTIKPILTVINTSDTAYTKTKNISFSIQDTLSGLRATSTIEYAWSKSATIEPTTWKTKTVSTTAGNKAVVTSTITNDPDLTGVYYLWIKGGTLKDLAGNKHNLSSTHYGPYYFDNTPPTVPTSTIRLNNSVGATRANSNSWTSETRWWGEFSASDSASGVHHYEYSDGCSGAKTGELNTSGYTYSSSVDYKFCIRAVDNVGNPSNWSNPYYFKIDKTPPTVPTSTIRLDNSTGAERTNSDSWTKETRWWGSFSASDSASGVHHYEYSNECSGVMTGELNTSGYTYSSSVDYKFCIRAVDNVGNPSNWSNPYYFKIDKDKPAIPSVGLYKWKDNNTSPTSSNGLTAYTNNTWSNLKIVTFPSGGADTGGSGFKEYQYTTTGATTNATETASTQRSIEANGTSYITWRACDNAGNCSDWSTTYTIKVDKKAPSCTITKITTGETAGVDYQVTCSDSHSGVKKCAGSKSTTVDKTDRTTSVTHKVSDNAGNESTCSMTVTAQKQKKECSTYKSCSNSNCGNKSCTSASCCGYSYSGSITCCNSLNSVCDSYTCTADNYNASSSSFCKNYDYNGSNSNNCSRSAKTCSSSCCGYKSCRTSGCGCETWGKWKNTSSCTASENVRKCRTVYN